MIAHLCGKIKSVFENGVIIDVNGVGYEVICSKRIIRQAQTHDEIFLYTTLSIREDSWTLFGFASEQEKFWFKQLTSVQGVGGRMAIAILSVLSDDDIYQAFVSGDRTAFSKASGVGTKLSMRIISELKDKIVGKVNFIINEQNVSNVIDDVMSALINLGYQRADVVNVISSISDKNDKNFDELLKTALSKLSL